VRRSQFVTLTEVAPPVISNKWVESIDKAGKSPKLESKEMIYWYPERGCL